MRIFKKENFDKFMKEHNLTKTQFCKNCGISVSTYNNLIKGSCPRVITVVRIAVYTGFKLQDILMWTD